MNESDFPHLHTYRSTARDEGSPQAAPAVDRNTFIANLNRIGSGAAGDRVMEGLVMACQSLCAQAVGRLQVGEQ